MSRRLRPEERASARPPISDVVREFIQIHLARGATPKVVAETVNQLVRRSPEELRRVVPEPRGFLNNQPGRSWQRLAGQSEVTLADVRRVYDSLRKYHHGEGALNVSRRRVLEEMKYNDIRRAVIYETLNPGVPVPPQRGMSRKLHDLAVARRFGASTDELQRLSDEMDVDIPVYLQVR